MLLSILVPGKNDSFRYNGSKTLRFNLHQTLDNIEHFKLKDVELVLCDWGSEQKIVEHIIKRKHKNFKCVYVPPEIAKKYNGQTNYSIVHPINTAFRNSSGKYVCFWDSDCFVLQDSFKSLYEFVKNMDAKNDMSFYWASRYDIPYDEYNNFVNITELENYINESKVFSKVKIAREFDFRGGSIAMLMNRELWESSSGWWEKLIYWGWQDIEFNNRLLTHYKYGGDLEDFDRMKFYHLCQPTNPDGKRNKHLFNQHQDAHAFHVNEENWGLKNEQVEIIQ